MSTSTTLLLLVLLGSASNIRKSAAFIANTADVHQHHVGSASALNDKPKKSYSYDLGLGRNSPLSEDPANDVPTTTNVYQAAQYLMEYESDHDFPSPYETSSYAETIIQVPPPLPQEESTLAASKTKKTRTKSTQSKRKKPAPPKVQPKRHLEDVLFILTHDNQNNANSNGDQASQQQSQQQPQQNEQRLPVMVQPGNSQLDLNSIWVEMLLHDQQSATSAPHTG
eukprot:scaffold16662_cov112-Cylindrotheca_fusiformis.AAC.2